MAQGFDPLPLQAFFSEVQEQLGITLKYLPENTAFPIQIESKEGIPKHKCIELLQFIKGQVDMRDNEIGHLHADKESRKYHFNVSLKATKALADIYALSFFYPHDEESEATQSAESKKLKSEKTKKEE